MSSRWFMDMVNDVFSADGPLAAAFPGYQPRAGQIEMTEEVAIAIEEDLLTMVEAGTGTGKSFAYLVPALLSGKKTIVSTANKVLQDQLVTKDLPFLVKTLGLTSTFGVLKGKSNYLCLRKTSPLIDQLDGVDLETGDLDAALTARQFAAGNDCIGKRCPFRFAGCYYYDTRAKAQCWDVTVVNHALLCQHLAHPDVGILAEDAHTLIVDEAHQLESYAMSMRKYEVGERHFEGNALDGIERKLCRQMIGELVPPSKEKDVAIADGARSRGGEMLCSKLQARYDTLAYDPDTKDDPEAMRWMRQVDSLASRVSMVMSYTQPGNVRHGVMDKTGRRAIVCEPIHARQFLARIAEVFDTVVYTSATITTGPEDFGYAIRQLGLDDQDPARIVVDSPFDYARQCCLYLPEDRGMPDPGKERKLFNQAVAFHMQSLVNITQGGALLLFTSWSVMKGVGNWLKTHLDYPVRIQGDGSRAGLIEWLRNTPNAVLCGTASFWEGIDVQGDALRLVAIDKLPMPTVDPVNQARQAEHGNKGFIKVAVPEATLKLKQGFGRLIRSTSDRGVVAILDPRVFTKGYGKKIRKSLPDALVATNFEDVATWYEQEFAVKEVA